MTMRSAISAAPIPVPENQPLRRAIRRLRWFRSTFEAQVEAISAETGVTYRIDTPSLTNCFVEWLRRFEAQKPGQKSERRAYVGFSAGLMLQQLIANGPVSVLDVPAEADRDDPAYFWPEGYVYVAYCLNIRRAVMEQEFDENTAIAPQVSELRTWWSFRENAAEDSSSAIAFLDLFAGEEPDWEMPGIFRGRTAQALELHPGRAARSLPGGDGAPQRPDPANGPGG